MTKSTQLMISASLMPVVTILLLANDNVPQWAWGLFLVLCGTWLLICSLRETKMSETGGNNKLAAIIGMSVAGITCGLWAAWWAANQ